MTCLFPKLVNNLFGVLCKFITSLHSSWDKMERKKQPCVLGEYIICMVQCRENSLCTIMLLSLNVYLPSYVMLLSRKLEYNKNKSLFVLLFHFTTRRLLFHLGHLSLGLIYVFVPDIFYYQNVLPFFCLTLVMRRLRDLRSWQCVINKLSLRR